MGKSHQVGDWLLNRGGLTEGKGNASVVCSNVRLPVLSRAPGMSGVSFQIPKM